MHKLLFCVFMSSVRGRGMYTHMSSPVISNSGILKVLFNVFRTRAIYYASLSTIMIIVVKGGDPSNYSSQQQALNRYYYRVYSNRMQAKKIIIIS